MVNLSRKSILERFPWAKEKSLFDKIDTEQDFDDSIEWNLNEAQLPLVVMLFEELEEWILRQSAKKDIEKFHKLGLPVRTVDELGVYDLYPDGRKEYVKLYIKGVDDIE